MNYGKLLAWSTILLAAMASIGYLSVKDWRRALYWALVAGVNATVTFE